MARGEKKGAENKIQGKNGRIFCKSDFKNL
jgi:hypothetical protein